MSELMSLTRDERIERAQTMVTALPTPDYMNNFQVTYDVTNLIEAMAENLSIGGVAQPAEIDSLSAEIAAVGTKESDRPIIITNSCAEEIHVDERIGELAQKTLVELAIIRQSQLIDPIAIQRICGQFVKPRSSMTEEVAGKTVTSYMGDGINGRDPGDREPDASRLVSGAIQSRDLQQFLTEDTKQPVLTAHEALSLPYEVPFVRIDPETGKKYLQSAHLPWIGKRTNQLGGVHLDLLAEVENTVGIKVGADSNAGHIAGIAKKLNPDDLPGKIAFMIRMSRKDEARLKPILTAIKDHAPESVVLYDIHGVTRTRQDGKKVRLRGEILGLIENLAHACGQVGLRLNGLHLETMTIPGRFECIDHVGQTPAEGSVDPRLNPEQTKYILDRAAPFINH